METKFLLILTFVVSLSIASVAQSEKLAEPLIGEDIIFEEQDGLVAVEAEFFYKQSKPDKRHWYRSSKFEEAKVGRDDDTLHVYGASNNAYLEILPDTRVTHDDELKRGENFSDIPGIMATVHYRIKINNTGRYYVWARAMSTGGEDNGVHVGMNGEWPEHGRRIQWCEGRNRWTWASKQRTKEVHCGVPYEIYFDIEKEGVYDIQFSMREDGFEFDKFLLTQKKSYKPQGEGPGVFANGELPGPYPIVPAPVVKIKPPAGRLAIIADGNSPDPDDLGGTAVSLALLRASGLENRLVHYSHCCDLVGVNPFSPKNKISTKAEIERHALMQAACDVTARRWSGFENLTFFDAKWQMDATIKDLAKAINASTADDPLWIIEAGEPDIIGFALAQTSKEKHKYVKVITHHAANDDSGDFYSWQEILDFGVEEVRIPDQNIDLKVDIDKWEWARTHSDPRIQQVWLQGKIAEVDNVVKFQKGKWDCSDAGMVLYWITGANVNGGLKKGKVDDVKKILLNFVEHSPEVK